MIAQAREVLLSEDKRRAYDAEIIAAESSMFTEADQWQGSSSTSGQRTSATGSASGGYEAMFHVHPSAHLRSVIFCALILLCISVHHW